MSCGSRFPPKRKGLFPTLAVMRTLRLAGGPEKPAMTPSRETGALSRQRSPAGRVGADPCSTPHLVNTPGEKPTLEMRRNRRPRRERRLCTPRDSEGAETRPRGLSSRGEVQL
jgi:hypothetical protein